MSSAPQRSNSLYSIVDHTDSHDMPQQWSGVAGPSAPRDPRSNARSHDDKQDVNSWLPAGLLPEVTATTRAAPPQTVKARRGGLIASYAVDWGVSIALIIAFSLIDRIDGYHRPIDLLDTGIQYIYATHERVPVWALFVIAVVFPVAIILLIGGLIRRSTLDVHNGLLGLLLAVAMTMVVTDTIKLLAGRPRPDLIDRCQPAPGSANAPVYGLSDDSICTRRDLLKDGFRSFLSGHSSTAFSGLGYLSFWLAGKLHLFDRRGQSLKSWIALTPLVAAVCIAVRTIGYRH